MKRTYAALILAIMLAVTGCGRSSESSDKPTPTPTGESTKDINSKAVESFMEHYLTYVIDMNDNAKRSFYSKSLLQKIGSEEMVKEPHVAGYVLGNNETSDAGTDFSANLLCEVTGEPWFSIDAYSYTLINEDGSIKIDKISKKGSMELIGEGNKIYLKKDDESEKQQAVTLDDLPDYSVMQTGSSPEQKFPVPKEKFTSCGMDLDGKNLIITSTDNSGSACFIAKVTMKQEEEALQQDDEDQGGKQDGDKKDKEKNQDKEKTQDKEKSMGIVKPLDLINGCQAYGITFSPEFDKFIVGLLYSNGMKDFRIYDMESGKIIEAQTTFLGGKVSSEMPYFVSSKEIQFKVSPAADATDEEKSYGGKWMLDIESGKVKQIQ